MILSLKWLIIVDYFWIVDLINDLEFWLLKLSMHIF